MSVTSSFLGFSRGAADGRHFFVHDRKSGEPLDEKFVVASDREVDQACQLAYWAFRIYRKIDVEVRARFLEEVAQQLESRRDEIVAIGQKETALPEARLNGELSRTTGQLKFFADIVREGNWANPLIDEAQPDRAPLPRPDIRSVFQPLGPIAVFGASNFPLAFSVAGGDTASALAAGCPVVVKAHAAHPGTSALAATAIEQSALATGMPDGVFSMLFDDGFEVGSRIVQNPLVCGVGFTGSRTGGLALLRLAQQRPVPIPFFAEMSSVNPVFFMPQAMAADPEKLAESVHASVTMGVGQFCTNPGILVVLDGPGTDKFVSSLSALMGDTPRLPMLTETIAQAFAVGVAMRAELEGILAHTIETAALFEVSAQEFLSKKELHDEIFGPTTLVVRCQNIDEAVQVTQSLEGNLTASIHGDDHDLSQASELIEELELKVGRLIVNQFPTGVEVCSAMVHGGPYPATSDSRFTSVGARAIARWARPICYQNFPMALLPPSLR